jgi:hypothetical protein
MQASNPSKLNMLHALTYNMLHVLTYNIRARRRTPTLQVGHDHAVVHRDRALGGDRALII